MTEGKMDGTTKTLTLFWRHALTRNLTTGELSVCVRGPNLNVVTAEIAVR